MTATKVRRVPCPAEGCGYTMDSVGSIPAHVAMAHPEVPMDLVAPKRSAASAAPLSDDTLDQRWLDDRIAAIEDGIEAVLDIARNWTDGRNLARLHSGVSAAEYVTSRVGTLGKAVVPVLLSGSNWSNRQIATVAGISEGTVRNVAGAQDYAPEPRPVLGADGKIYAPRPTTSAAAPEPTPRETAGPVLDGVARALSGAAPAAGGSEPPRAVTGEVIDPPEPPEPRRRATKPRPEAMPVDHLAADDRRAHEAFCRMTSKSTGQGCQQPERWLMAPPPPAPLEVCQQHGRMLERQGWTFVRELHPVPGFDRNGRVAP